MRLGARFGRLKKTLLFFVFLTCFIMLNYIGPLLNAHMLIRAMIDKIRGMMKKAKNEMCYLGLTLTSWIVKILIVRV